nr:hypothetical protein [Methylobacterium goesingense]
MLNKAADLPYDLRVRNIVAAMEDVYDFFHDVNGILIAKGLKRLDEMLRPAAMSGIVSDMLTASVARQSRTLVENGHFNGHPDLLVRGRYPNDSAKSGTDGIEIKSTRKAGGAVDTHGGRNQWMCVFVYEVSFDPKLPAIDQEPMRFTEVYLGEVEETDFRHNERGALGTRTSTLHGDGIAKLRQSWVYLVPKPVREKAMPATPPPPKRRRGTSGS